MAATEPILRARGLSKAYSTHGGFKRRVALSGVDMEVFEGEVVVLLGLNGSGKSTLLRLLAGAEPAGAGKATIFGFAAGSRAACTRTGYVSQELPFANHLSARSNLADIGYLFGLRGADLRARVDRLLLQWGMAEQAGVRFGRLSRGQMQRLAIAQSLINDPDLLLLDEPTSGLDALGVVTFESLMKEFPRTGKSVVISSHIASDVRNFSTRAIILKNGAKVADAPVSAILEDQNLREFIVEDSRGAKFADIEHAIESTGGRIVQKRAPFRTLADLFRSLLQ
ncbi:MAG: ABC transporter ATP-binding protein [Planctomycetes bacterium]|nr:ABC transporter ATP-binding protein [Planctomycetota bacterium]